MLASRSIARSGYLFVAPDWDFSVPLNRTKRWQRRWFVLYDDGELNYSVDEHPETVPQGSVDMSQVLEVTGAEQITGHPHSLALTGPDRVTFVKAASREDARWWAELLAVFPRRHKRNATFPGGRASPSLPQLGRSASPQPPRPRHLSCTGPSPRTNFTTPPLKEERESPNREDVRPKWPHDISTSVPLTIEPTPSPRIDYVMSSGSPPTRDKLRCEDKAQARVRQDWRKERFRDIATALTDRSPESSLALPAEGLLHLKKGWLWFKDHNNGEWQRLWWVLCGPTLSAYKDQDEQAIPEVSVELSTVTNYSEIQTETRYGFQIQWSGPTLTLSAITSSIRSNWMQAFKKAAPNTEAPSTPATPRSALLSSDEEYRTASEGGRRDSEDWSEYNPTSPMEKKTLLGRVRDRNRLRPKLPRSQSRQSTVDSVSTDELDTGFKDNDQTMTAEVDDLKKQLTNASNDLQMLESEITRLKKQQTDSVIREKQSKESIYNLEMIEKELSQKIKHADEKFSKEQKIWSRRISDYERDVSEAEDKCNSLSRELQTKQRIVTSLQEELKCANERLSRHRLDNDRMFKKLQEIEGKNLNKSKRMASLTDLTDIDLDIDLDNLNQNELIEQCIDLRSRFEKAVVEIRAVKKELRESHLKYDELELENVSLKSSLDMAEQESQAQSTLMASRVQDLTNKYATVEKQARSLKSKLQDSREKRRSLSLKGRENFSINKEVEDKVTELEAKILSLEHGRSRRKHKRDRSTEVSSPIEDKVLRRIRRKSLDSATSSEPMKLLMRLSALETKVNLVNTSNESLMNNSFNELNKTEDTNNIISADSILRLAKDKFVDCRKTLTQHIKKKDIDCLTALETCFDELDNIFKIKFGESEISVVSMSAKSVVLQLENLLREKLKDLEEKKNVLREAGELDQNAKMEIFAEKIAFENLVIGRIEEAVKLQLTSDNSCERLLSKETVETANLLAKLELKLTEESRFETPNCLTSIASLTKVLTKRLLYCANGLTYPKAVPIPRNLIPAIKYLEEEQNKVANLLSIYKTNKLPKLAEALALESLSLSNDESCRLNIDEATIWNASREIINSELITSEINHVLMRTAQNYETISSSDQNNFFTFFAYERAMLELWSDAVENSLRVDMERYIEELNVLYELALAKIQRQNCRRGSESDKAISSGSLLKEFADIIAHKALIDSRISVLRGETENMSNQSDEGSNFVINIFDLESCWDCLENLELVDVREDLQAEFKSMLGNVKHSIPHDLYLGVELVQLASAIKDLEADIVSLGNVIGANIQTNGACEDFKDILARCGHLRQNLKDIEQNVLLMKNNPNNRCEDEERKQIYLGTEYLNHVRSLRAAYREALSNCESEKQQRDLETLQLLCERVLVAMEQWHRKTLQDLRDCHGRELQALRQEKEQALAEETQATLAALDAMRKAHEAEVLREVARFKQNFAREQQSEMLELKERLSVKCLEAAALHEQLGSATRQLSHAQQQILQLERSPFQVN
ncbi:PREDICTED: protein outspread isoform X2 [Nicrophorus vespilloides]|uniref:Protein outspread isoform X2 n=1 Tax=Nicrophorus vespilloides TaxID=110193 RepID=A0ABM1NGN9_NICVS|nr:PREDICTED: protein outspread isoform X2 [Nicrophorus vespilloides]